MNRGRRKAPVFFSDADYEIFLKILRETVKMFCVEIHAFSLMPNHYHLLLRTPRGNLSRVMRHINGVYTQKINLKYKLDGSLFRGRFKSILIGEESYFLELIRYVHRNPYKAGLENKIGEYKWCSHGMYIYKKKRPEWLTVENVLKEFNSTERAAIKGLHAFVNEEIPEIIEKKLEHGKWPSILGGEKFTAEIDELLKKRKIIKREIPEYYNWKKKDLLDEKQLREFLRRERNVLNAKRSRKLSCKRRALIYVIKEKTQKSNRKIAEMLGGITDVAVSMHYRKAVEEVSKEEGCYKEVRQLLDRIKG